MEACDSGGDSLAHEILQSYINTVEELYQQGRDYPYLALFFKETWEANIVNMGKDPDVVYSDVFKLYKDKETTMNSIAFTSSTSKDLRFRKSTFGSKQTGTRKIGNAPKFTGEPNVHSGRVNKAAKARRKRGDRHHTNSSFRKNAQVMGFSNGVGNPCVIEPNVRYIERDYDDMKWEKSENMCNVEDALDDEDYRDVECPTEWVCGTMSMNHEDETETCPLPEPSYCPTSDSGMGDVEMESCPVAQDACPDNSLTLEYYEDDNNMKLEALCTDVDGDGTKICSVKQHDETHLDEDAVIAKLNEMGESAMLTSDELKSCNVKGDTRSGEYKYVLYATPNGEGLFSCGECGGKGNLKKVYSTGKHHGRYKAGYEGSSKKSCNLQGGSECSMNKKKYEMMGGGAYRNYSNDEHSDDDDDLTYSYDGGIIMKRVERKITPDSNPRYSNGKVRRNISKNKISETGFSNNRDRFESSRSHKVRPGTIKMAKKNPNINNPKYRSKSNSSDGEEFASKSSTRTYDWNNLTDKQRSQLRARLRERSKERDRMNQQDETEDDLKRNIKYNSNVDVSATLEKKDQSTSTVTKKLTRGVRSRLFQTKKSRGGNISRRLSHNTRAVKFTTKQDVNNGGVQSIRSVNRRFKYNNKLKRDER